MKIRAYVNYNEYSKKRYYRDFELVDEPPAIGDIVFGDDLNFKEPNYGQSEIVSKIREAYIDCENSDDIWQYDFYIVVCDFYEYDFDTNRFEKAEETEHCYCILKDLSDIEE